MMLHAKDMIHDQSRPQQWDFFFKTNTFDSAYCHGAAKSLCHAMHGGAMDG